MVAYKKKTLFVVVLSLIVALVGFSAVGQQYGGTLRVATIGEPPHLDLMVVTSDLSSMIGQHVFETLFTFDETYSPVPFLITSYEKNDSGTEVTFYLRQGVLFHNGEEMNSGDVVASLKRWGAYGSRGPIMYQHVLDTVAVDKYTVKLVFDSSFGPMESLLAFNNGGPCIIPQEIAAAAGVEPISPEQYIGTGPYKFVEWIPGRYIRLVRFEDYASLDSDPTGYAGARNAYLDEIHFIPVSEAGTRVAGIQANDYDYAQQIPADLYTSLVNNPNIGTYLLKPPLFTMLFRNTQEGIMSNDLMLQAVLAALDMEPILQAGFGDLTDANGSVFPEGTAWYTDSGMERYSQADPQKAQELLAQIGYDKEPIRYLVTTSYEQMYAMSMVITDQLRRVGFNIQMRVYDWATLTQYRGKPNEWDLFMTWHGPVPDPSLVAPMSPTYPGWWDTPEKNALVSAFNASTNFDDRYKIWEDIQALQYKEGSWIKLGDAFSLNISANQRIDGLDDPHQPPLLWPYFWNVSLK